MLLWEKPNAGYMLRWNLESTPELELRTTLVTGQWGGFWGSFVGRVYVHRMNAVMK